MKNRTAPALYASLYPSLVAIARAHGYALAVHGSMARDFDLIAIPWTIDASEPLPMILEMKNAVGGVFTNKDFDDLLPAGNVNEKHHGRRAWSIHLTDDGCDGPYLDISVMPKENSRTEDERTA